MPSSLVVPSLLLLLCPPTHGSALLLLLLPLLCSEPGHSSRKPSQRGPGARKTSGIPPLGRTRNCKSAAAWTGQTCGWSKKRRRHLTVEGVWSNHEQRGHSHVDDGTKASALSRFTRGSNLLPPPPTSRYLPWHKSPWHNPMSPRLSPSLPQMVGGEATTSCHHICAFFGEFGFTVQFVLAFLSFSALIFKRYQVRNLRPTQAWSFSGFVLPARKGRASYERCWAYVQETPRRPIEIFRLDALKNGLGAALAHFMNIFIGEWRRPPQVETCVSNDSKPTESFPLGTLIFPPLCESLRRQQDCCPRP